MTLIEEIRLAETKADEMRRQARQQAREHLKSTQEQAQALRRDVLQQAEATAREAIAAAERDAENGDTDVDKAGEAMAIKTHATHCMPQTIDWIIERIVNDGHR